MTPNELESQQLASQKLREEVEKVRLENASLRIPLWRTPAFFLPAGGLAISLLTNFQQFEAAKSAATISAQQVVLSEQRWATEREKLAAEIDALRTNTQIVKEDRTAVKAELKKVNDEITFWDGVATKSGNELMLMQAELARLEKDGKFPESVKATRENIETQKGLIERQVGEKVAAVARRAELEKKVP